MTTAAAKSPRVLGATAGQAPSSPLVSRLWAQDIVLKDVALGTKDVLLGTGQSFSTTAPSVGRSGDGSECSQASTPRLQSLAPDEVWASPVGRLSHLALLAQPRSTESQAPGAHTIAATKANNPAWQNQDAHLLLPLGEGLLLAAVFDGHGQHGRRAAERAREVFTQVARQRLSQAPRPLPEAQVKDTLLSLFSLAHGALAAEQDGRGQPLAQFSGATATCALIDEAAGTVATAHVGDSAAMLVSPDGKVVFRTEDHAVDDEVESRCLARGGEVRTQEVGSITARRVFMRGSNFPGIMMGRSLGDLVAHQLGLLSEPEIRMGIPFGVGSTLVLASDGVWEHMQADEVASQCSRELAEGESPAAVARDLAQEARARWPAEASDDITAMVVTSGPAW